MAVGPPPYTAWVVDQWAPGIWGFAGETFNRAANGLPVSVSSWWRGPDHNASVGGNPDSQHLIGTAVDAVVWFDRHGIARRRFTDSLRASGWTVVEYPTHVHAQVFGPGEARQSGLLRALGL